MPDHALHHWFHGRGIAQSRCAYGFKFVVLRGMQPRVISKRVEGDNKRTCRRVAGVDTVCPLLLPLPPSNLLPALEHSLGSNAFYHIFSQCGPRHDKVLSNTCVNGEIPGLRL